MVYTGTNNDIMIFCKDNVVDNKLIVDDHLLCVINLNKDVNSSLEVTTLIIQSAFMQIRLHLPCYIQMNNSSNE